MPSLTFFHSHSSHMVKPLLSATGYASPSSYLRALSYLLIVIPPINRELGACSTTLSMDPIKWCQASNSLTGHMKVLIPVIILSFFLTVWNFGCTIAPRRGAKKFSFVRICNLRLGISYLCIYWHGSVRILSH